MIEPQQVVRLVAGPASFVTLRFLLGVAEAGFFPGIILYYLTYWFPEAARARIVGAFMTACRSRASSAIRFRPS